MLKMVRVQNPKMPFKEAQQVAKDKYAEFKATLETQKKNDPPIITGAVKTDQSQPKPSAPGKISDPVVTSSPEMPEALADPNEIPYMQLVSCEKQIRSVGINRNSIIKLAGEVIKGGELVTHGKDGVNTLVTFEDKFGNKVPVTGYFKVFIAR